MLSRTINFVFLLIFGVLFFSACKREEPTTWDIAVLGPIAHGEIGFDDLINDDELLTTDANGLMHVLIKDSIVGIELDSLVQLPDTSIVESFTAGFTGGPLSIPQGTNVITNNDDFIFGISSASLRQVALNGGWLEYKIKSYINGELDVAYALPGVTLGGVPFELSIVTSAGSADAPFEESGSVDLNGYNFDLSGGSGTSTNSLASNLDVSVFSGAAQAAEVYGTDSLSIELKFIEPSVFYARGYFGNQIIDVSEEIDLEIDDFISGYPIQLEAISFQLDLENSVGVDASLLVNELIANRSGHPSVALDHELIGSPVNITRATIVNNEVISTSNSFLMDESNSNVTDFISLIPSTINLNSSFELNPLQDVSGGNDFIFTQESFQLDYEIDIPLCFGIEGLSFRDTLELDSFEDLPNANGLVILLLENYFPVGGDFLLKRIEHEEEGVFLSEGELLPATLTSLLELNTPSISKIEFYLENEDVVALQNGAKFELMITLYSENGEEVKFSGNETINAKIITDANLEVSIE